MTLKQARTRYPLVPEDIVRWAIENIDDVSDLDRGLTQLQQAIRLQRRFHN
jgi:hypothetical protein